MRTLRKEGDRGGSAERKQIYGRSAENPLDMNRPSYEGPESSLVSIVSAFAVAPSQFRNDSAARLAEVGIK